jgi:hypothetical protein
MEFDITIIFCELYFNLLEKNIQIILKNNDEISGYINGYYYEDIDNENKKIATWHFVETNADNNFKKTENDFEFSKLIPHKIIKEVKYLDNNLKFQTIKFI